VLARHRPPASDSDDDVGPAAWASVRDSVSKLSELKKRRRCPCFHPGGSRISDSSTPANDVGHRPSGDALERLDQVVAHGLQIGVAQRQGGVTIPSMFS